MPTNDLPGAQVFDVRAFLVIAAYFALFTLYTGALLALTDNVLHRILPDYQFSGSYGFGLTLFFFVGIAFTSFGQWRGWTNWRFFIIGALGVFFPLVFLASTLRMFIAGEESMIMAYTVSNCDVPTAVCGKAFAASVFTMSLRALPTVVTAPALYWYLLIYRANKNRAA